MLPAVGHSRPGRASSKSDQCPFCHRKRKQIQRAMLTAAKLVEPALDEFYATLSSEQKARFNTLQQVASP
ncbi:Spy/CpxP family protein refolding chaperone [Bradyrhizobium liaoningense]